LTNRKIRYIFDCLKNFLLTKPIKNSGGIQMANAKKLFAMFMFAALFSGSVLITGCGGGPSPEQMQQLNDLRAEVESLQSQVNDAMSQKSQLERQIADKDAKVKAYLNDIGTVQKRCP